MKTKSNHPFGHKEAEDDYFSNNKNESDEEASEEEGEQENDNEESEDKTKTDKKQIKIKTIIRKPQPKLDSIRLCGPRGIKCLMEQFEKFKPKGDGNEFKDLEIIVSKYEYWTHRLFPKMKFSDVIDRLEKLGEKREVKNLLHRIRLGDDETQKLETNENYDPALEDEMMTAKVMDMMNKIQDSDREDDYDEDTALNEYLSSLNPNYQSNNKKLNDTNDNEDDVFNKLLNS